MLRYYDAAGAHFKGAILLDGCEVNALPAATRPQDKFVFEVVSGERRNYVLACATEELRGEWLQKLEEEISRHSEILMALAPEAKTKRRASIPARDKGATCPPSKAPIPAVFHSFRLMCGRAILSRNGLDAWMLFLRNARARGTLALKRTLFPPRSIQSAKAAADEESAEAEAADDDGDAPEEPPAERPPLESPGSKKGSMFNLFKRSSSKDLGAGPRGRRPPAPGASTERRASRARSRRRGSDGSTAPLEGRDRTLASDRPRARAPTSGF